MAQVDGDVHEKITGWSMETMIRDIGYGCRSLARAPGFAAAVVLTLALTIGANATVFSVMNAVMWKPLPYPSADRLVLLDADARGVTGAGVADAEAADLRAHTALFAAVAKIVGVDAHLTIDGEMERVAAASASDDALPVLGATPLPLGRPLDAARDDAAEFVSAVVISDELWRRRFNADPGAIGRHIEVNNLDVEVIGVLPPGFRVFLPLAANTAEQIDVWFPRGFEQSRRSRGQATIARLRPGVTIDAVQAELDVLGDRFVRDYAQDYAGGPLRLWARPLRDVLTSKVHAALWLIGGAVAFVLVIGCVNVANLMLARGRARERELAVRRALGAGRVRLVRQLLTENAVLVVLGAGAGFLLAYGGVSVVEWLRPSHLPRQSQMAIDSGVVVFTAVISLLVTLAFGLLPALRLTVDATHTPLRAGRSGTMMSGMRRLQRGLVIAEVALSSVLLVGAGLMLRTFVNLTRTPLGFDPSGIVTAKMPYSFRAFPDVKRRWPLHRDALDRLRQLPGVEAVSGGSPLPFDAFQHTRRYARDADPEGPRWRASVQTVLPGYLQITGTTLREGRDFTEDDITNERPVVIVDERLARQLWPGGALGQRLAVEVSRKAVPLEVIGVTNTVRVTRVQEEAMPHFFVPYHFYAIEMALVVKTHQTAAVLGPSIKRTIESLGTRRPVYDIRPMQAYVEASIGDTRFTMLVLVGFAAAALLLAGMGLYATLAYLMSQRTQEIGVRMALGASTGRIVRSVLAEGALLCAVGTGAGLAGATMVTGAIRGLLYHVAPFDGGTLAGAAALMAGVALIAAGHPAFRAARVDPAVTLRAE